MAQPLFLQKELKRLGFRSFLRKRREENSWSGRLLAEVLKLCDQCDRSMAQIVCHSLTSASNSAPHSHSLPSWWDKGENWMGKSDKTCGLG